MERGLPLGLASTELLGRAKWCTVKSSCFGDEHVLGDAAHRLPKNGGCGSGRDEVNARSA